MEHFEILTPYFTREEYERLLKKKVIEPYHFDELLFLRLSQEYKRFYRGTVFYKSGIIPGYPRIPRILHLENGIRRYFKDIFYVEEKMDGYNVRISISQEKPLAFTRGGFICPFTTDRIYDLVDLRFFDKYPDYILCGEVVGRGNPYNIESTSYSDDIAFFVFDIFESSGKKLPPEERYHLLREFNFKEVRRWGPFRPEKIKDIKDIVLELDSSKREGIVVKSADGKTTVKYVTLASCLMDLDATGHLITELPSGFFIQRILRAIFFSHEFGIPLSENYLLDSARALYLKPLEDLKKISAEEIKETFTVKVRERPTIDKLMKHLNRAGIKTKLLDVEKVDGYCQIRFVKFYKKGTKELRQRLMGKSFYD